MIAKKETICSGLPFLSGRSQYGAGSRERIRGRLHRFRSGIWFVAAALTLFACCPFARGQSGAGSIEGTVTDPTGAVIPGASIHVVKNATNVASNTKSNGVGFYQVPDLFTGSYSVTVTATGMKTYSRTIELLVGQTAVINVKMSPGAVTQKITVTGNTVQLIDTTNGTISSTLDNARISQLPMNGRNLTTLASDTVPGLAGGVSDQGLEDQGFEYVADGVPLNNDNFGGQNNTFGAVLPDPDSIQEVTFNLSDTPAQYAAPGTAVITTKSGTNQLHGSFFETAINSYWGVAKTRNDLASFKAPPYIRNEFGASAGGPIVIPHLYNGKDKSFWFFAYERYSLAATSEEQVSVPTMAERSGDFNDLFSGGVEQTIYDPSTTAANPACPLPPDVNPGSLTVAQLALDADNNYCRSEFDYNGNPNTINPAEESPGAKLLYAITPQPTNSNDPLQAPDLNSPDVDYVVTPTITWRLDHEFNENNKAYLRYQQNIETNRSLRNYPSDAPATVAVDGFPAAASGYQIIPDTNFAAALGYTHIFSPTFFAETVLSQNWWRQYVGGGGNPNLDYDKMLALPNNFGETGFPVVNGLTTMNYGGTMYQYQENQIISEIDENLTKTIGKHQLQFGGRIRHDRFYYLNSRNADTDTFTTFTTGLEEPSTGASYGSFNGTGLGDASEYLGNVAAASVQLQDPPTWFRDEEFDAYFEDTWHVKRNLNVDLGLRYEAHPARTTRNNVIDTFDLKNQAIVLGQPLSYLIAHGWTTQAIITNMEDIGAKFETPSQAGLPNTLYEGANLEFSPRASLAWQPFGSKWGTVLRGGYGRYAMAVPTRNQNPGPIGLPFAYGYTQNYNAANQSPDGIKDYPLREVGDSSNPNWIVMGSNASNIVNTSTTTAITPGIAPLNPGYLDPDFKPSIVTEVNTTLEQPLKWNSALRISWAWTHGSYLDHVYAPNATLSDFDWEMITGITPPEGNASVIGTPQQDTYAATALNPYNNTVWGNFSWDEKNGWSNDNELQINYQRLFSHGFAFQIYYVWDKELRIGSNGSRDSGVTTAQTYYGVQPLTASYTSTYPVTAVALPPARPAGVASYADYHALDKFEDYQIASTAPPQDIVFNYLFDLPFGRGKRFFGGANRFVNEVIGGYQIAGVGHIVASQFQVGSGNWGPNHPIQIYKHKMPIKDCLSGNCYPAYMWFNGYIPPTENASSGQCTTANGVKTGAGGALECIYGLPSDYTPYQEPIDTVYGTEYYNSNNITVNLANGKTQKQGYGSSTGTNFYSHTFIPGVWNWESDLSLYKVFPIKGTWNLRFNADAFNFLNHQGWENPNGTDGIEAYYPGGQSGAGSANSGRQMQFTLRLTF